MAYSLTCQRCGVGSPEVDDEDDVVDAAVDAGWLVEGQNEDEDDLDMCRACANRRTAQARSEKP